MIQELNIDPFLKSFYEKQHKDSARPSFQMAINMVNDVMSAGRLGLGHHEYRWNGKLQDCLCGGLLNHVNFVSAFNTSIRMQFKIYPGDEHKGNVLVEAQFFKDSKGKIVKPHFVMHAEFDSNGRGGIVSCVIHH